MDNKPLLLSSEAVDDHPAAYYVNNTDSLVVSSVKRILKCSLWVVFIAWIAIIFLFPVGFGSGFFLKWIEMASRTPFGITGAIFMIFSGPILLIAFLAILYLIIAGEAEFIKKKTPRHPRFRLWTFPVLVDGPFGVVSAAEFLGITLVILYVIWAVSVYTLQDLKTVSTYELPSMEKCSKFLEKSGLHIGSVGLFCLALLFLPIARGSALLRLIDIPFEHATRYHVWLGHLTMFIFTLHGCIYIVAWLLQGRLLDQIFEWKDIGVANLAGVISLVAGLLMWVTSFETVRKLYFELFFYTHQLYIVFVIFLILHVGDFVFSICAGGVFLFMLDRFLRFCQSRKTVKIISATCFPCGTMELVISKPANMRYNALSFVFMQIRELSWLQWHPFSVSSSPLDGKNHLSIMIKVLGEWTESLKAHITGISISQKEPPLKELYSDITASVEGPYGHESPYHLTYENLILVAGGIGISPFLAILSDILHRIKEKKPCIPKNILLVWAIKKSDELPLISTIDGLMDSIYPVSLHKLNIQISIYVTQESEPPLEEGKHCEAARNVTVFPYEGEYAMSGLAGTGNNIWSGMYVISSIVGFVILMGLVDIYYINAYGITTWWYKGFLFGSCMVASILIFGGIVVGLWHLSETRIHSKEAFSSSDNSTNGERKNISANDDYTSSSSSDSLDCLKAIHYGYRPDFREIFGSISKEWGNVDIGVIVCGPSTLQSSVAKECRSMNFKRTNGQPIFHFNSHSFDL